jgi:hypothetical protein
MRSSNDTREKRTRQRPHSSYSSSDIYRDVPAATGVPLRCQYCAGQAFRRSTLRPSDFVQLVLMRYPVRCLRCSQRQMVSFTVAGISLSSSVKPQRPASPHMQRTEPTSHAGSTRTDPPNQ